MKKITLKLFVLVFAISLISCDKEDDPIVVQEVQIATTNFKTNYYIGQQLDLSGVVVQLNREDGSVENVPFSQFENADIITEPANGTELSNLNTQVKITHTPSSKTVSFGISVVEGIASAEDDYEINNTFDTATVIGTCDIISATINSVNDVDFYRFSGLAGETIQIKISNIPSNFLLKTSTYFSNQQLFSSATQTVPNPEKNSSIVLNEDAEFYFAIEVANNEYSSQSYQLCLDRGNCN